MADPQRRESTRPILIIALVSCAALLFLCFVAAIAKWDDISYAFGAFARAREKAAQTTCLSNVKEICLGIHMYAQDNDERLPLAANWCDATYKYVKNRNVYPCPLLRGERCGYAYNVRVQGLALRQVAHPASTVLCFDATGGWNLAGGAELVAPRHNWGANFGLADGHAKWFAEGGVDGLGWDPLAREAPGPRPWP